MRPPDLQRLESPLHMSSNLPQQQTPVSNSHLRGTGSRRILDDVRRSDHCSWLRSGRPRFDHGLSATDRECAGYMIGGSWHMLVIVSTSNKAPVLLATQRTASANGLLPHALQHHRSVFVRISSRQLQDFQHGWENVMAHVSFSSVAARVVRTSSHRLSVCVFSGTQHNQKQGCPMHWLRSLDSP
jgi:hypothetical protein